MATLCSCSILYILFQTIFCLPLSAPTWHNHNGFRQFVSRCFLERKPVIGVIMKRTPTLNTDYECIYVREHSTLYTNILIVLYSQFRCHHECPMQLKCHSSYCIPSRYVCDGIEDCPYGKKENSFGLKQYLVSNEDIHFFRNWSRATCKK